MPEELELLEEEELELLEEVELLEDEDDEEVLLEDDELLEELDVLTPPPQPNRIAGAKSKREQRENLFHIIFIIRGLPEMIANNIVILTLFG